MTSATRKLSEALTSTISELYAFHRRITQRAVARKYKFEAKEHVFDGKRLNPIGRYH